MTWSALHANLSQTHFGEAVPLDISSVLPLFQEEAQSAAMIRHSMTIAKGSVNLLNPGQVPWRHSMTSLYMTLLKAFNGIGLYITERINISKY